MRTQHVKKRCELLELEGRLPIDEFSSRDDDRGAELAAVDFADVRVRRMDVSAARFQRGESEVEHAALQQNITGGDGHSWELERSSYGKTYRSG